MTPFGDAAAKTPPSIYDLNGDVYHDLHPSEIRLVKLLRANRPAYKALSYAWGSPRATRPILVNGYQHSVTVNLESALRRLRQIEGDLTLWVDALSINQSNNSKKTEQINLMHDIFSYTEEVIFYLGEVPHHDFMALGAPTSSSTTAFSFDERDGEKLKIFRSRCSTKAPSKLSRGKAIADSGLVLFCLLQLLAEEPDVSRLPTFDPNSRRFIDSKYQRNLFEGLRHLMLCRWWNRIWVIQEVVVPKTVTIVYGSTTAPWDMFTAAASWDQRNRSSSAPLSFPQEYSTVLTYFSRNILDIESMRRLWKDGKQTTLLPLLRRFSGRKASDDRDKVYALLSLARDQTSIVLNYSLSVPKLFQSTVLDIINTTKSLNVLAGDLGRKDRQDLPSWVPDWSASYDDLDRRRAENTEDYDAECGSLIHVQNEGDEELSGLRRYLGDIEVVFDADHVKRFSEILGTPDWIDWLPDDNGGNKPTYMTYLSAINNFYLASGTTVCLENHGSGVIGLAGFSMDRIKFTGAPAFSEDSILPTVHS